VLPGLSPGWSRTSPPYPPVGAPSPALRLQAARCGPVQADELHVQLRLELARDVVADRAVGAEARDHLALRGDERGARLERRAARGVVAVVRLCHAVEPA